jgi:two-component system, OmpR family, phosphate regulon sensor histidine kinase PhoR
VESILVGLTLLAAAVAVACFGLAVLRGRRLAELRQVAGSAADDALPTAVRAQIDARDQAEIQRDQARGDLAYLADLLTVGVLRLDDDLRVAAANAAAHLFLGRERGTLVGARLGGSEHEDELVAIVRRAAEAGFASGEIVVGEDERTLMARGRRSPHRGIWLVIDDLTELRTLQRVRREFIDNLAHELRTPLTNVGLLSEVLAREAEGEIVTPRMRDRVARIDVEVGHMVQMVNELLDLTRIESGQPLLLDDVDVGALAASTVERLRLFAERQGVQITTEIAEGLPPVRGDEERLEQVIVNLLHNAVKFSRDGGEVTVRVAGGQDASDGESRQVVTVSVVDHGVGIPAADLRRIFERFYKVDKSRVRRAGGTGLGLAIARHVVENHGGRIWADSVEGEGATFTFVLPLRGEAASGVEPA